MGRDLPADVQRRVQAATVDQLDRYAERVLSAGSLDEVLADDAG